MEGQLRQGRQLELTAEDLARELERTPAAPAIAVVGARLRQAINTLAGERRVAAEWSPRLLLALRQLGWHGSRPLRSDEQQTVARWHALLDEYAALGGWLLEDGNWLERPIGSPKFNGRGVDLTQWNHRAAMARDYYVRVVYAGFLFPYGHAASLVKVTERKFEDDSTGQGRLAVLRQRFFIIVRQRTRLYQHPNQAFQGRDLPFARIDCLTTTTPDIANPI